MKVESIKVFSGVSVYSQQPAVVAEIESGDIGNIASSDPGFRLRLNEVFPNLRNHGCDGCRGGFIERWPDRMEISSIIGHIARELFTQADPTRKDSCDCGRRIGTSDHLVVVATNYGETFRYLIPRAVSILDALLHAQPPVLENILEPAREILAETELGPSGRCIVDAAIRRGIPWTRENEYSLVQLGYGRNLHYVQAGVTSATSDIAVDIVGNKNETKKRLRKFSIPTPAGFVARTEDEAISAFERIDSPVVVKPLDGNQGKGVSLGLTEPEDVKLAFHHAQTFSSLVLVEELLYGKNYRVLVVDGKLVAASERQPCTVTGDGVHTLQQLVEIENQNPMRGEGHEKPLTKVKLTPNLVAAIQREGWELTDVPDNGTVVQIGDGLNLSTGGTAKDVTDIVHRSVQLLCERAARVVDLDICGIDLMLQDISKPMPQERGGIIEINAAPGLRMHVHPSEGTPRDVGDAIVEMLYPNGASSRIPIVAVTGTNGKTTVTRMVSHILRHTGRTIGTTTTDGILINGESVVFGDTTGPASAKTILSDRAIDIAVLETARGGIVRRGLGWDWADVGVITNITEDHIGQDGIESIKDLVEIKSLIAERVREGGTLVLNADDAESSNVAYRPAVLEPRRTVVYFSTRVGNPIVEGHVNNGGLAYVLQNGWINEVSNTGATPIASVDRIPCTIGGTAGYQIQNVLAAAAASRALGLEPEAIADALHSFQSGRDNMGRSNMYRVGDGVVVIDYGHNPKAIESVCEMISTWGMKSTAIVSFPGDRKDEVIETSTKIAARGFDRLVLKGDKNLRGRAEGEVPELMKRIVAENNGPIDTRIEIDGEAAFEQELLKIGANEVVVFFYEKLAPVIDILNKHNAVATEDILLPAKTRMPSNGLSVGSPSRDLRPSPAFSGVEE